MTEMSPIYYRLVLDSDGKPTVAELQWFDEYGYDDREFLTPRKYDSEAMAWAALRNRYCGVDESPAGFICTLPIGHTGHHSAIDVHGKPYATWEAAR